jgi:hypothetical protein
MIAARAAAFIALCAPVAASAFDPSAALLAAVARAEAHWTDRYAFTADVHGLDGEAGGSIPARFDPRLPAGERWTLLSRENRRSPRTSARWRAVCKGDDADGGLIFDGLAPSIAAARLISRDGSSAVFAAPIRDEEAPQAGRDGVEMRIAFDLGGEFVRTAELAAQKALQTGACRDRDFDASDCALRAADA